jgi:hypothetical protein
VGVFWSRVSCLTSIRPFASTPQRPADRIELFLPCTRGAFYPRYTRSFVTCLTGRPLSSRAGHLPANDALQPTGAMLTPPHPATHLVEAPAAERWRYVATEFPFSVNLRCRCSHGHYTSSWPSGRGRSVSSRYSGSSDVWCSRGRGDLFGYCRLGIWCMASGWRVARSFALGQSKRLPSS